MKQGTLFSGITKKISQRLPRTRLVLQGKKFGRLIVLHRDQNRKWLCRCDCGNTVSIQASSLLSKRTVSCGCFRRESARKNSITHGLTTHHKVSAQYSVWRHAKDRASKNGLEFNLELEDVKIPELCPALGIPIIPNHKIVSPNSPSLDRLNPNGGYTRDNVCVLSHRANAIKRDASVEELRKIADWLEMKLACKIKS